MEYFSLTSPFMDMCNNTEFHSETLYSECSQYGFDTPDSVWQNYYMVAFESQSVLVGKSLEVLGANGTNIIKKALADFPSGGQIWNDKTPFGESCILDDNMIRMTINTSKGVAPKDFIYSFKNNFDSACSSINDHGSTTSLSFLGPLLGSIGGVIGVCCIGVIMYKVIKTGIGDVLSGKANFKNPDLQHVVGAGR